MTPRIGIDGRVLGGRLSGIGRYVNEICRELDRQMPEARFFVYGQQEMARPSEDGRWTYRVDRLGVARKLKPVVWSKLRPGLMARADQLDLFWGTGHFLPMFMPERVRTVFTVYDLVYHLYPQTMSRPHLLAHRLFFPADCRRANRVVAISEGTGNRLAAHVGRHADAIVRPAVSPGIGRRSETEVAGVLQRLGLSRDFVLSVSTVEPRKNYASLVAAFVSLRRRGLLPQDFQLVIVGGNGWRSEHDMAAIKAGHAHGVRWLGFVDDAALACLYSGARLYVCPSLYEGFGIPAIEAIACGAPVLLSDTPELREAGGNWAEYTEPTEGGLEEGIMRALNRSDLAAGPRTEPSLPTWQQAARTMREVFHSSLAGPT